MFSENPLFLGLSFCSCLYLGNFLNSEDLGNDGTISIPDYFKSIINIVTREKIAHGSANLSKVKKSKFVHYQFSISVKNTLDAIKRSDILYVAIS